MVYSWYFMFLIVVDERVEAYTDIVTIYWNLITGNWIFLGSSTLFISNLVDLQCLNCHYSWRNFEELLATSKIYYIFDYRWLFSACPGVFESHMFNWDVRIKCASLAPLENFNLLHHWTPTHTSHMFRFLDSWEVMHWYTRYEEYKFERSNHYVSILEILMQRSECQFFWLLSMDQGWVAIFATYTYL